MIKRKRFTITDSFYVFALVFGSKFIQFFNWLGRCFY